jgi:hypothetical protein
MRLRETRELFADKPRCSMGKNADRFATWKNLELDYWSFWVEESWQIKFSKIASTCCR